MTTAPPLDYDSTPRRRRRWGRWALLLLLLGAVAVGVRHRVEIARRIRLAYWQHKCLTYTRPPGTPLHLPATSPVPDHDYVSPGGTDSSLSPECWRRFDADRRPHTPAVLQKQSGGTGPATLFLHQLTSPGGNRRLIRIEADGFVHALRIDAPHNYDVTVIAPGTLRQPPRDVTPRFGYSVSGRAVDADLFFAQPDPTDPSRFSFDFSTTDRTGATRRGTVDAWLNDDDTVTFQLRDPATTRGL